MSSWNWLNSLLGSTCVLVGSAWACAQQLHGERVHLRQLHALASALEAMGRELQWSACPMEKLLKTACSSTDGEIRALMSALSLQNLEYKSISEQWIDMTRNKTLHLNTRERRILGRPGPVLGRCGVEQQCLVLSQTAQELRSCAEGWEGAMGEKRRLWYTLSISAALLLVVMLL